MFSPGDTVGAIQNIYTVAKMIYDQVQLVKANKQQCQRLANRIKIIGDAVRGLEKLQNKVQYFAGLKDLLGLLEESFPCNDWILVRLLFWNKR